MLLLLVVASGLANGQKDSPEKFTLAFENNKVFSEQELTGITHKCLAPNSNSSDRYNFEALDYCLRKLKWSLAARGYLQAAVGELRLQETASGLRVVVPIEEGVRYRLGDIEIKGSRLFSPTQIREMLSLESGDIADADSLSVWLFERVRQAYDNFGYIQYTAEPEPTFQSKPGDPDGIVNFTITIDEGNAFLIRSIKFAGNDNISEDVLQRAIFSRRGEVFNKERLTESLKIIDQMNIFEVIDSDKDVDYRADKEDPGLDITIRLKKKT